MKCVLLTPSLQLYTSLVLLTPRTKPFLPSEKTFAVPRSPSVSQKLPILFDPFQKAEDDIDLSIVIPAFNESTRLPLMLEDTLTHLTAPSTPKRKLEIIIVDDGSKDDTSSVALQFPDLHPQYKCEDQIRVVKFERNRGKGGAVQAGVLGSRGRRVLMVDADGASRFADLEKLWSELDTTERKDAKLGVAVGSRAHLVGTEAVVKRSAVRNFLMHSFHLTLRTLGVSFIQDTQCGFKLFTRPAAALLFSGLHLHSWLFDVELLLISQFLQIPVVEVPVGWHEVEGSKLRILNDSVGMLRDLIVLRANYALGRWVTPQLRIH